MPNLVVTRACSLGCSFCFAASDRAAHAAIACTRADLDTWLRAHPGLDLRLCGGEPTEHPAFAALLARALAEPGRRVFLMTHGLWPESVRRAVRDLAPEPADRLEVLINLLPAARYRDDQRAALDATLDLLAGRRLGLGATVDRQPYDVTHLLARARRHRARQLRFSVAAPSVVDASTWTLDPDRDFAPLAQQLVALAREARQLGLRVQSDCGYLPPCAFDATGRAALLEGARPGEIEWTCHGPIDVDPHGEAWRCYGLSTLVRGHLADHASLADLGEHFEEQVQELAAPWLYAACADCAWRRAGTCGGGCHALRLVQGLRRQGQRAAVDVADDAQLVAAVHALDGERLRPWPRRRGTAWMLRQGDTWVELGLAPLEVAILEVLHRSGPGSPSTLPLPATAPGSLARALRLLLVRGAIRLLGPA